MEIEQNCSRNDVTHFALAVGERIMTLFLCLTLFYDFDHSLIILYQDPEHMQNVHKHLNCQVEEKI